MLSARLPESTSGPARLLVGLDHQGEELQVVGLGSAGLRVQVEKTVEGRQRLGGLLVVVDDTGHSRLR